MGVIQILPCHSEKFSYFIRLMKEVINISNEKLIAYIDGSYYNCKGGWSCVSFHNYGLFPKIEIFGSCQSFDSGQMEVLACIKAIANMPRLYGLSSIPCPIEFRTDYYFLVNFINGYNHGVSFKKLLRFSPRNLNAEFMELYKLLQVSKHKIKAKKVNSKDSWLKKVDRHAKYALHALSEDNSFVFCIKGDGSLEKIPDAHKNMPLEPRYSSKQHNKVKWIKPFMLEELVHIPTELIQITEDIHLHAKRIDFRGGLKRYKHKGHIDIPIVVRPLPNGTYSLVVGISRLCIAKLLGFKEIPAFISDTTHEEFMQKYGEDSYLITQKIT